MDKSTLRKNFLKKRDKIKNETIIERSNKIIEKIINMKLFKNSQVIMVYVSYGSEIYTHDLIRRCLNNHKKIVTPICNTTDNTLILAETKTFPESFIKNKYGILELDPKKIKEVDVNEIDLIITPGVAFTEKGERLGYGGGYYDRLFAEMDKKTVTVAPVFKDFIVNFLPVEAYDKTVDYIVSEEKIIEV